MSVKRNISIAAFLLLLFSCATENDLLVNPPPRFETVKVRFLNLAGDGEARSLTMEYATELPSTEFGQVSTTYQPPADSVFLEVKKQGNVEFKSSLRFRFGRNITYTFVALPSASNAPNYRNIDTVIAFATSISVSRNPNEAYIKMLNANSDSTVSYSLVMGCPNGHVLSSAVHYRRVSPMALVRSGELPLSIIKHRTGGDSLVGLFYFDFQQRGQYTIIIKNSQNGEEVILLDEANGTTQAITKPQDINVRVSHIRAINLSTEPIRMLQMPGEIISDGLIPFFAERYISVSACSSMDKDTLGIYNGSDLKSTISTSLEVLEKYTVVVLDSAERKAEKAILIEPVRLTENLGNRAVIRVLNGDYLNEGLSVSIGAREIPDATGDESTRGFRSGESLASRIVFGELTGYRLIEPGLLPIAIFTSTEPAKLISTARIPIEAGKQYVLIVYTGSDNKQKITIIEDGEENKLIEPYPEGVFVQAIHATAGKNFISMNFPGLFSKASLNYSGSLATVIEAGTTNISIDGIAHTLNADSQDRILLISSGTAEEHEIFDITDRPLHAGNNHYIRRYINASKQIPLLNVKINEEDVIMPNVEYMKRSSFERIYQEKKFSLFFDNAETNTHLTRIDDLFLTYSKTFSIIFAGHDRYGGYSVIIQQEY